MELEMYLEGKTLRKNKSKLKGPALKSLPKQEIREFFQGRKHPDLHLYIDDTFGKGRDDCQPIYLTVQDMLKIIAAVNENDLPDAEGYYSCTSTNDAKQKAETIQIFEQAIIWLITPDDNFLRYVSYLGEW